MNGLSQIERVVRKFPRLGVVVVSVQTHEDFILNALKAGAKGFLAHNSSATELRPSLHAAAKGRIHLSRAIPKRTRGVCLRNYKNGKGPQHELTPRQKSVLKHIAEGRNTKEIANQLKVSSKTVEFHRARLMNRLGIRDTAGLVRYALRSGLVPLDA